MNTGERRRLIVLLSIAGVLVVGALLKFTVFNGGGGSSNNASSTRTEQPGTGLTGSTDETTPTSEASRSTSPPATFDVFATKNPFEPVIIVTPPDTTPSTTPSTTPGGGTTPGTTPGGGTTPTGASTSTTTTPSVNPSPGTSVALLDVFPAAGGASQAKVQVGSTVYTVGVGSVFATSYRVVSLSGQCGQFLFGDSPFKLCEGEEVIK
ncbi:MAG TPA: hypothetical protein VH914_05485 [Acidimicrobiia bacterium]|jgi:hypothetical protein|nr:hypothetical protein [Acidimicrobiia bacterium]